MQLTDQEKEELFLEFAVKMAEMDKEEKKLRVAKNNHALKGMAAYYWEMLAYSNRNRTMDLPQIGTPGVDSFDKYFGLYSAYLKLRNVVPNVVMIKKHSSDTKRTYDDIHHNNEYSDNPTLSDDDVEEATKFGKMLIDTMIKYLEIRPKNMSINEENLNNKKEETIDENELG